MQLFHSINMSVALVFLSSSTKRSVSAFAPSIIRQGSTTSSSSSLAAASLLDQFQDTIQSAFSTVASSMESSPYHTVAITGSSGMIGTALIDELSKQGDAEDALKINGKPVRIVQLQRSDTITSSDESAVDGSSFLSTLPWNPKASDDAAIDPKCLESIDTIVHLAGENVGTGLLPGPLGFLGVQAWSDEKKDLIMNSRVGPTQALADAIAECSTPTSYIVASGVGVYGCDFMEEDGEDSAIPDESFDTSTTDGFLADVSRAWEAASQSAAVKKNRVTNLRLAPVMSKNGGALGKLYPIFFLGGGGNVGSGKQYFSYISARDAARSIVHIMNTPSLKGPVNLVAPTPCTNAQFTQALGKALFRPTILPLPGFVVKTLFGEMGEEMLLGGVKAYPAKLVQSGFEFNHGTIDDAIESALNEKI